MAIGSDAIHAQKGNKTKSQSRLATPAAACDRYFLTCSSLPMRLVWASSSSCFSFIDSAICLDAPLSSLLGDPPV
jgi:hypothetical protein